MLANADTAHTHSDACYNGDYHTHESNCYTIGCTTCNGLGYKRQMQKLGALSNLDTPYYDYYYYCVTCDANAVIDDSKDTAMAECGHGMKKAGFSSGSYNGTWISTVWIDTTDSIYIREACPECKTNTTARCGKTSGEYYDASGCIVSATCNKVVTSITPKH